MSCTCPDHGEEPIAVRKSIPDLLVHSPDESKLDCLSTACRHSLLAPAFSRHRHGRFTRSLLSGCPGPSLLSAQGRHRWRLRVTSCPCSTARRVVHDMRCSFRHCSRASGLRGWCLYPALSCSLPSELSSSPSSNNFIATIAFWQLAAISPVQLLLLLLLH